MKVGERIHNGESLQAEEAKKRTNLLCARFYSFFLSLVCRYVCVRVCF